MCGIAGYIDLKGRKPDPRLIERMLQRIHHRGPDEKGVWRHDAVCLGTARLAIIDLETGQQPLSNEDDSVWVAFNGEIYNFQDLRDFLKTQGHQFRTRTDTEVIVHAYEEWGSDFVSHLNGMFGIALVDLRNGQFLLTRDAVGEKPVFYTRQQGFFAFCSELKPLLHELPLSREIEPLALQSFWAFSRSVRDLCAFKDIQKLLPGEILQLDLQTGKSAVSTYWRAPEDRLKLSEEEAAERLLNLLEDSIRRFVIADVPVGAFLSGGTDSSAVVAMMRRFFDHPVKTFTAIYDDPHISEAKEARQVADLLGTEHHEIKIHPADIVRVLPKLLWHFEEPFADASFLPTYFVSQKAREFVTVALTGDGGDELFGGYDWYFAWKLLERYKTMPGFAQAVGTWCAEKLPLHQFITSPGVYHYINGIKRLTKAAKESDEISMFQALTGDANLSSLVSASAMEQLLDLRRETLDGYTESRSLERILFYQFRGLLPELFFTKVDRMSMANSLECRSPLVYADIVRFALRLPMSLKVKGSQRKYLLKRVFERFLPKEILYRPKKGFTVPFYRWFREDPGLRRIVERYTLDKRRNDFFEDTGINSALIASETKAYLQGKHNRWSLPWKAICFGIWHRTFVERDGQESLEEL